MKETDRQTDKLFGIMQFVNVAVSGNISCYCYTTFITYWILFWAPVNAGNFGDVYISGHLLVDW